MIATPEHDCQDAWLTAKRIMLALASFDEDAYDRAMLALGDCMHCWRCVAVHSLRFQVGEMIHIFKGQDKAVAELASEIGQMLGVGHAGEYPVVPDDISGLQ